VSGFVLWNHHEREVNGGKGGLKLKKMSTPEIARRTNHSEEAVDRYINDYERVTRISGIFEPIDIAYVTNLSESLVIEYLDLKKEFQTGA